MKRIKISTLIQLMLVTLTCLIIFRFAEIEYREYKYTKVSASEQKSLNTRLGDHRSKELEGIAYVKLEHSIEMCLAILFLLSAVGIQIKKNIKKKIEPENEAN